MVKKELEKAEHKPSGLVNSRNGLEDELEDLIDCYLEIPTTWTPKLDIPEELKPAKTKESKASDYHQKSPKVNHVNKIIEKKENEGLTGKEPTKAEGN
ncbi:13571_t:CDS:1, partial [Cetraspora pellucida]